MAETGWMTDNQVRTWVLLCIFCFVVGVFVGTVGMALA